MAIALLVIGWVTLFGADFRRSGEGPGTFLLSLVHPLVAAAVLGMLLPALTAGWRRVLLPYLALLTIGVGDAIGVGGRLSSGHQSLSQQIAQILAFCLLGLTPWISRAHVPEMRRLPRSIPGSGRIVGSGRATIVSALAVAAATLVVLVRELVGTPNSSLAVVGASPRGPGRRGRGQCGAARPGSAGARAGLGDQRGAARVAGFQRQPARARGPDQRRGPGVRPGGPYQLREPGGGRLRLFAGGPGWPPAGRSRPPGGPGHGYPGRPGGARDARPAGPPRSRRPANRPASPRGRIGPAGPSSPRGNTSPGRFGDRRRAGPVPGPGPDRRRDLAARRVDGHALPRAWRAGPAARDRARRQRSGGAAPADHPPDLPRRADRPAEPGLPRRARPGRAGPPR